MSFRVDTWGPRDLAGLFGLLIFLFVVTLWWVALCAAQLRRDSLATLVAFIRCNRQWFSDSAFDRKVVEIYESRRLEHYHASFKVFAVLLPPIFVAEGLVACSLDMRNNLLFHVSHFILGSAEGWGLVVVSMLALSFPRLVTLRCADFCCGSLFVLLELPGILAAKKETATLATMLTMLMQFLTARAVAEPCVISVPNFICLVMRLVVLFVDKGDSSGFLDDHVFAAILFFAIVQASTMKHSIAQLAAATATARELQANGDEARMESLLSLMCDATVALHADLTVRKESKNFVGMLLRNPRTSMTGSKFTDYIATADVPRFLEFVQSRTVGRMVEAEAGLVHVNLKDCMGSNVPVQVFHSCMIDPIEGLPRHLIGVVEDNKDGSTIAPLPSSGSQGSLTKSVSAMQARQQLELRATHGQVPAHRAPSSVSSISSTSSVSEHLASMNLRGQPYIAVQNKPPFILVQVGHAMRTLWNSDLAALVGHPFTSWVKDDEDALCVWLRGGLDEANRTREDVRADFGPIMVRPAGPGADGAHAAYKMLLTGIIPFCPGDEQPIYIELKRVNGPRAAVHALGAALGLDGGNEDHTIPDEVFSRPLATPPRWV